MLSPPNYVSMQPKGATAGRGGSKIEEAGANLQKVGVGTVPKLVRHMHFFSPAHLWVDNLVEQIL